MNSLVSQGFCVSLKMGYQFWEICSSVLKKKKKLELRQTKFHLVLVIQEVPQDVAVCLLFNII